MTITEAGVDFFDIPEPRCVLAGDRIEILNTSLSNGSVDLGSGNRDILL